LTAVRLYEYNPLKTITTIEDAMFGNYRRDNLQGLTKCTSIRLAGRGFLFSKTKS
jgi:hypothetical protein